MRPNSSRRRIKARGRGLALEVLEARHLLSGPSWSLPSDFGPSSASGGGDPSFTSDTGDAPVPAAPNPDAADAPAAASPRGVIGTYPADGARLTEHPASVAIDFPQEI